MGSLGPDAATSLGAQGRLARHGNVAGHSLVASDVVLVRRPQQAPDNESRPERPGRRARQIPVGPASEGTSIDNRRTDVLLGPSDPMTWSLFPRRGGPAVPIAD